MATKRLRTYALIGFSVSGRGNIICVTRAKNEHDAAAKLGGEIIASPSVCREQMTIYAYRLPPSPSREGWSLFRFDTDESVERLATATEPDGDWVTSVRNTGRYSDHLVLAEMPYLK